MMDDMPSAKRSGQLPLDPVRLGLQCDFECHMTAALTGRKPPPLSSGEAFGIIFDDGDPAVKHSDEVFQIMTCEKVSVGPAPGTPHLCAPKGGCCEGL